MKKKKGFTLIEIIVCIALLATVSTISIITIKKNNEKSADKINNKIIEAATVFMATDKDENGTYYEQAVNNGAKGVKIPLTYLKDKGYISEELLNKVYKLNDLESKNNYYLLAIAGTGEEDNYCGDGSIKYVLSWTMTEDEPIYLCKTENNTEENEESQEDTPKQEEETKTFADLIRSNTEKNTAIVNSPFSKPGLYINSDKETAFVTSGQYFRGNVENNYVNFAGMCWRIVRIDDYENIKLILEDQDNTCKSSNGNWNIPLDEGDSTTTGTFGYSYFSVYDPYRNIKKANFGNPSADEQSAQVTAYQNFQTKTLSNKIKTNYSKNLSDYLVANWCFDNKAYDGLAYAQKKFTEITALQSAKYYYYHSYIYLYKKVGNYNINFTCDGETLNKYSDNTDMYVATLTAKEIIAAGGKIYMGSYDSYDYKDMNLFLNSNYYLINSFQLNNNLSFWTMTPFRYNYNRDCDYSDSVLSVSAGNWYDPYPGKSAALIGYSCVTDERSFRPAIILKSNVTVTETGNGTKSNPYVVS